MKNPFARRNPWLFATAIILLSVLCLPLVTMAITADATSGGTGASSLALAGLMGAPLMLRDKADEGGDGGGGGDTPDVAAALAKLEDGTLTMSQRLSVAVQALKGIDPTNQLAKVKTDLTAAQTALQTKESELATVQAELEKANKRIAALTTDVTEAQAATAEAEKKVKELETKEQDLAKRADAMARERMKGLGFSANQLPSATDKLPQESNLEDARKAFAEAKDPLEKAKLHQRLKALEAKALASVN